MLPSEFRHGFVDIMRDEQRHTRLHIERAVELGVPFGSLPVNDYIWAKSQAFESVLDYLAGLPLTFEGRNLDHTLEFESLFRAGGRPTKCGDPACHSSRRDRPRAIRTRMAAEVEAARAIGLGRIHRAPPLATAGREVDRRPVESRSSLESRYDVRSSSTGWPTHSVSGLRPRG